MECSTCRAEIPDGDALCPACGAGRPLPKGSQWSSSPTPAVWALLGCAGLVALVSLLGLGAIVSWILF